ncbi:hypothetical protein Bbelb_165530 [Branchiostoma belcheri]|nr:hypothetical protein Bbelb_165530 [Branchiostoma belcheri]
MSPRSGEQTLHGSGVRNLAADQRHLNLTLLLIQSEIRSQDLRLPATFSVVRRRFSPHGQQRNQRPKQQVSPLPNSSPVMVETWATLTSRRTFGRTTESLTDSTVFTAAAPGQAYIHMYNTRLSDLAHWEDDTNPFSPSPSNSTFTIARKTQYHSGSLGS